VGRFNQSALARLPNAVLTQMAASHLREMARLEPQLSLDSKIAGVTERAQQATHEFVQSRALVS
jgi:succinoglycan biosynthesis protein ExoV